MLPVPPVKFVAYHPVHSLVEEMKTLHALTMSSCYSQDKRTRGSIWSLLR